ncbi:MAG: hypothetical protein HY862_00280 [Chloroflexi bacterium]|nr:hypothetical protein [Chloroflexota bacterium]
MFPRLLRHDRRSAIGITITLCIAILRLTFWLFKEWVDDQQNKNYDLESTPIIPTSSYKSDVLTLLAPNTTLQNLDATLFAQKTDSVGYLVTVEAEFQQTLDARFMATAMPRFSSTP